MKIEAVRVQNYKSILDSGWVDVEDGLTTLVGANEAGKTNFLEALSKFKTGEEIPDADLSRYRDEYPDDKSEIPVVSIRFSEIPDPLFFPSSGTFTTMSLTGPKIKSAHRIEISRYANGDISLSNDSPNEPSDRIYYNFHDLMNQKLEKRGLMMGELDSIMPSSPPSVSREADVSGLISEINSRLKERHREELLGSDGEIHDERYKSYSEIRSFLRYISENEQILGADEITFLPNLQLYRNIKPISEGVGKEKLRTGSPYFEILNIGNIDSESLEEISLYEADTRWEEVNELITKQFNANWSQADVRFQLKWLTDTLTLRIYEQDKENDREIRTLPSERSQGFRWYLSFFCHLIARNEGDISDSVILLDDPGAYLHPEGHKDLKSALGELADENQVLYSTHSPYMIDKTNLNSVRTVRHNRGNEDEDDQDDELGTVVEPLSRTDSPTDDSLESVRMALGASFSDSLFTSKYTILVEGHDDRLYLEAMSELLEAQDRTTLHDDAVILDCGGASKVDYLARIVNSEEYNFAVLLDDDQAGQRAENSLEDSEIESRYVTLVSDVLEGLEDDEERTIEDLFADDLFCEVAAEVHDDAGLDADALKASHRRPSNGIVEALDGRLKGALDIGQDSDFYDDEADDDSSEPDILRKIEIAHEINNRIVRGDYDAERLSGELDRFEALIENINDSLETADADEEPDEMEKPVATD